MRKRTINKAKSHSHLPLAKLKLLYLIVTVIFIVISLFLGRWQILDHDKYNTLASSRLNRSEQPALRGDILAQDGSVFSYSEPRFDIYLFKDDELGLFAAEKSGRQTRREFVDKVSKTLEINPEELEKTIEKNGNWLKIASKVTKEMKDAVLTLETDQSIAKRSVDSKKKPIYLDGLNSETTSIRVYPEGDIASHLVGFLGKDEQGNEVGRFGLEQYFDNILKPQNGISLAETDSNQNIIATSENKFKDASKGTTIKTTIDKNIQIKVNRHVADAVERFKAKSASVIIVDPRSGKVIAMANYPKFDPNNYNTVSDIKNLDNISITYPYEIGSVGKVFTMAAAVDQGKVNPNTVVINGHRGCQKIIEERIICTYDKKPQGALTATDAMIKSDNLALFKTAEMIGPSTLAEYLENFGMGKKTNIMLSGEDWGYIKPGKDWNEADLAAYSYGHSYYQTPLQAVMGVAAIANDGKRMEPLIVSELIDSDGRTKVYEPRAVSQVISPESSETMAQIMYKVFLHNLTYESKYKDLRKYYVGMKSGTALIPYNALSTPVSKPGYSNEVNATYIGYDASDKNTFAMIVNVSEPQTLPKLSYNNARLLWLDIFTDIKDDLGVPAVF